MTILTIPAALVASLAIVYMLYIFAILSRKLGAVTKMKPYYRWLYVALALVFVCVVAAYFVSDPLYQYLSAPMQAALDGAREVGFTILSMTLSLAAVFIPVLFMGGIIGRLFHEFAVTIGVAILVSGFVSLTLTPMLCARVLKGHHGEEKQGGVLGLFERLFEAMARAYQWSLDRVLAHKSIMLAVTVSTMMNAARVASRR